MIANHWVAKLPDDPLEGHVQPPQQQSEAQRVQQATEVKTFAQSILGANPNANLVVLGDLNDSPYSDAVQLLDTTPLHDLITTLPTNQQYTYVFEGNSEVLDHILVSDHLFASPFYYAPVHVNSDFDDQVSDHDPQVVHVTFTAPTTVATLAPPAVNGFYAQNPTVTLSASDAGGPGVASISYTVDGAAAYSTYSTPFAISGDGTHTLTYFATDTAGVAETPHTLTLTIDTTAPTTTASVSPTPSGGQVNGPATVTLNATDATSGVASTRYSIDGGAAKTYAAPFTITAGGLHTVTYASVDQAGNTEGTKALTIQVNPQATTSPTGNVPSVLALSIGSVAPTFGAFTAGVAQTYSATVGATATATAASSILTAADTSATAPGHLVNSAASDGPYALAQGLQVDATSTNASASGGGVYRDLTLANPAAILSYVAPVSDDAVTIGFHQPIAAGDPLRTGNYTKTVVFTLSTDTP